MFILGYKWLWNQLEIPREAITKTEFVGGFSDRRVVIHVSSGQVLHVHTTAKQSLAEAVRRAGAIAGATSTVPPLPWWCRPWRRNIRPARYRDPP